jgi:hypothetical protein
MRFVCREPRSAATLRGLFNSQTRFAVKGARRREIALLFQAFVMIDGEAPEADALSS